MASYLHPLTNNYLSSIPHPSPASQKEQACYNHLQVIHPPLTRPMATKKRKTTRKKSKATSKSAARKKTFTRAKSKSKAQPSQPLLTGISADRKMEIIGILLALVGLLTFIAVLSDSHGEISNAWVNIWQTGFGIGAYLLPLLFILLGVWLVAHNFERLPKISIERLLGITFTVLILLTISHLIVSPPGKEAAYRVAADGKGGGYVGAALMVLFEDRLGTLGMLILLVAWLLISIAMTLDVSVLALFKWVGPTVLRIQDYLDDRKARKTSGSETPYTPAYLPQTPPEPVADFDPPTQNEDPQPLTPAPSSGQAAHLINTTQPEKRDWVLPQISKMLDEGAAVNYNDEADQKRAKLIEDTLASFGAPGHVIEINRGPTITQFGVEPAFLESRNGRTRVRVGKIAALADDLSLALAASRIRIQAPVPGKGYIGIEVPNEEIAVVTLRDVIESKAFNKLKSPLRFALGQDVAGHAIAADLTAMPHLLVAGATGSGKSVFVNALISGLLVNNTPATLRFIMVDPKRVELTGYNGVPHLLAPVVTEIDRVVGVLQWVTREMDSRYQKFADIGSRNIADYNKKIAAQGETPIPYLVLVIDELADMMMIAPDQTERLITRMAQLARATGIHLVISTQRPSVDVVTGLIKANFPARISFAVASGTDSRVILDQPGAERLLGRGDMLFQAPDAPAPIRMQGVFLSENEILRIVQYWRGFAGTAATAPIATSTPVNAPPKGVPLKQIGIWDEMQEQDEKDNIYEEAVSLVRKQGRASVSMLQRRLRIGYTRASRLIDQMEEEGIIGPPTGSSVPRKIIDYGQAAPPAGEDLYTE